MKSILNKALSVQARHLVLTLLITFTGALQAQFLPEIFSDKRSGPQVKARLSLAGSYTNRIDTVTDDKFGTMAASGSWRSSFKHRSVYNRISISIKDTTKAMSKFDYLFNMTIDTFDALNRRGSFTMIMRFSYDPASHKPYIDKAVYQFRNCHKFIVKINSIIDSALVNPTSFSISTMQTNFVIESEIIVERYYLGSYSTALSAISHSYIGKDKLRISWTPLSSSAPNQYELEWAYVDTAGIKPDSLKYDFTHNSSRVLVSKTYYDINTVYDAGVILYRVRRVKPDSVYFKYNKYSRWKPSTEPDKGFVKNYDTGKVYVGSHEAMGKNWDYQVAFAEEGLKKEVVNYFDGSLKRRQGVTLSNTNNFALVDESIYDHHGREVIKIIPAPSDSNTIRYYKKFNTNAAGKAYSAHDFDTSTTMSDKCNGNYKAKPTGTQNGAGRYYSTSNPDKTNENAAIPDAQGYPLVQTRLTPDPTGRVEAQGGIGFAHQLGSGHETKYTYGSANQPELDKVFGSEVGVSSHYKKNAVTDPNGQMSISYIDQHGRVVATALTGGVPGMVDTVGNFAKSQYQMIDLQRSNKLKQNALVMDYNFNVTQAGIHKLYYKLEAPDFVFGCVGKTQCYSCRYTIEFTLSKCGSQLMNFKRDIGNLSNTSCSPLVFSLEDSISRIIADSVFTSGDSVGIYLSTGEYHLSKRLTVNTDSIEDKIEAAIAADSSCYKTLTDFIDAEMDEIDFSDCNCDTCGLDSMTYCETRKQLMMQDMSPYGQYFSYNEETFLVPDSTSVLRNWSGNPIYHYINASNFRDASGKIDTVWINGTAYIPNALSVDKFVEYFKESWAEALLPLHPEYCYYRYCVDSLQPSYIYDEEMADIDNYDTAEYYGYLNPLGNNSDYTELNNDPYFVNANGTNTWRYKSFNDSLHTMDGYTPGNRPDPLLTGATSVDIWQFSMAIGFCQNISDSLQRESCFRFYYDNKHVKNNWMNDKQGRDLYWEKFRGLYFQFKQKYIETRMNKLPMSGKICKKNIGPTCTDAAYKDKISHFVRYQVSNPLDSNKRTSEAIKGMMKDSLAQEGTCEASVAAWDEALSNCTNYSTYRDSILYHLVKVCRKGSLPATDPPSLDPGPAIIFGATDIPASMSKGQRFKSFEEVLKYFIGSNYKSELCNVDLIQSPRPYATDYENNKPSETNECICSRVKSEIQQYKGCYSKKDSSELGTEGLLINDFVNALIKYQLFNLTTAYDMDDYADLIPVANKLFAPVIGGSASTIKIQLKPDTQWVNERTFLIYNGSLENKCKFSFRLNPNLSNFNSFDNMKKTIIKPMGTGAFSCTIYKTGGTTVNAFVYNTCFTNIGKCEPTLAPSELPYFTSYFNAKYLSSLEEAEMEQLIAQCGNAGFPNEITDRANTMYFRYGSCPDYYRSYKEPKDQYMINFLNEMMRPIEYWKVGTPGFIPGDNAKRTLTTKAPRFHCDPPAVGSPVDFLVKTKSYHYYKDFVNTSYDNYWWEAPKFVNSIITIGMVQDTTVVWVNNRNKDPYFIGGFWIGARCDSKSDSTCFVSFGDPYSQLGKPGHSSLAAIDSLNYYRWDEKLGSYIVSAYDRSSPNDSVTLTVHNSCKAECNPLFRYTEFSVKYKDVFIKPGSGGMAKLSGVTADVGLNTEYINPFMDMMNGLAGANKLATAIHTNIKQFNQKYPFPDYYKPLYPATNGYIYRVSSYGDSTLIGQLQDTTGSQSIYCKFGLRKTGSNRGWNFNTIDVFKDFAPDADAVAEMMKNDQQSMAGFHFTLKAGNVNSPGDTTWYPVKGWSSCWKFYELSAISANGKALFNLPESFTANCNCYTCPETKRWSDSLYAAYPKLNPQHPNYESIVTNYINRKLNTTLSFTEIQSNWDACGVVNTRFIPTPQCSYRLSVKNTDCVGHADTMLNKVMLKTDMSFAYTSTKYTDSTEYCLDFTGYTAKEVKMLQDSLNKYFSSPYCSAFKKRINYRPTYDIVIYNLDSSNTVSVGCSMSAFNTWFDNVKYNLFDNDPNLYRNTVSSVQYSHDNFINAGASTWMSSIEFSALEANKRQQFEDTLFNRAKVCGGLQIMRLYYVPKLVTSTDGEGICLSPGGGGSSTCYDCDTLKRYLRDYQYEAVKPLCDSALRFHITFGGTNDDQSWSVKAFQDTILYVAGRTMSNSLGSYDAFLARIAVTTGKLMWFKTIGGTAEDGFYSLDLDHHGNVYCGGYSHSNVTGRAAVMIKFDAKGTVKWKKYYHGTTGELNYKVVVSPKSDYVYYTGTASYNSFGSSDIAVYKFDTLGNVIYAKEFGTSAQERPYDITADDSGNAYVVGLATISSVNRPLVAKIDGSGNIVFSKRYTNGGSLHNEYIGVVMYDKKTLYCIGRANGSTGIMKDFVTKMDINGNIIWTKDMSVQYIGWPKIYKSGNNLVVGDYITSSPAHGMIYTLDTSGTILTGKAVGSGYTLVIGNISVNKDGGVYYTGYQGGGSSNQIVVGRTNCKIDNSCRFGSKSITTSNFPFTGATYSMSSKNFTNTTTTTHTTVNQTYTVSTSCRSTEIKVGDGITSAAALQSETVETYLRGKTGKVLAVYEGDQECVGCANKTLYACEEPSDKLLNFVKLLNQVAKNKKLNSASYSLNSSYTSLLNLLKPTGTVLNTPKYKYKANTYGGWTATIQYNTTQYDVISVQSDTNDFFKKFNAGIDTFIQPRPIAQQGYISGFMLNARDSLYRTFTYVMQIPGLAAYRCCAIPTNLLCPRPYTREYEQYDPPCKEEEVLQAISTGTQLYYEYLDSLKRQLAMSYEMHCMRFADENIGMGLYQQRYHSTLYYYDQAGNLVKTVPPAGIAELNLTTRQDSIDRYRDNILDSFRRVKTFHILGTNYRYNSLNQLIWQQTPDGGVSQFWYDRLGRLVLSQNAVQAARSGTQKIYSYTRYDALGRICEVGEISNRAVNNDSLVNVISYYGKWLAGSIARTQITRTFYDYTLMTTAANQFAEGQRNLRGRVSSTAYYDAYAADSTQYSRATYYSYDIHGNVDHLVHDFPDMAMVNSRYKHITYKYDLISGKVHSVSYQTGQADQWFHKYSYDADNRLTLAETSTDSVIWDRDAEYKYYKHGPLARTLLGEHAVQGVDYAYTIHGWLKAVNSNTLVAGRDVGKDGTGSLRKYTARDAYGFTLGYYNDISGGSFDGDYQSIGTTSFEASTSGSPLAVTASNMYNGNITHMVSAVNVLFSSNSSSPLATIYKYDQLNRIRSVKTYNGINSSTNSWNSGSAGTAWNETFKYDANGNITNLTRRNKTTLIDNLAYNYKGRTNQLTSVDDAISSGTVTGDIDDQAVGNYRYDKIGNLTHDTKEEIDSIYWNVYGKIEEIKRTSTSTKPALSFRYDAAGQRVLKIVKNGLLETSWDYTWYVRDAQGNVMATYTKKNQISATDTSLYRRINNSIATRMNGDSLAAFIKYYFSSSQFKTNLANVIGNRNQSDDLAYLYHADTLLKYDNDFAQDILQNYCTYYISGGSERTALRSLIWTYMSTDVMDMIDMPCFNMNDLITSVLGYDNALNTTLNNLATLDINRFNTLYQFVVGTPPPPLMTTAAKITAIRGYPDPVVANNINNLFTPSELETIIENLSGTIQSNVFTNMDPCTLFSAIGNCGYGSNWYNFVRDRMNNSEVVNVIMQNTEKFYLAGKLIEKDPKVMNKIVSLNKDLISDALRITTGLDLLTYLNYIYQRFGRTTFNNILDDIGTSIKIQKNLTLDELHVYGSTRHGISKPKKLVVRKSYVLEEIQSDGLFRYSNATDSTIAKISTKTFKRTVAYKQYELTNHLGNVLATILDRKTAITNADTLSYYDADVSTAQMYYAFGSTMTDLKYVHDTGKYRYGFNNQEKDNEIVGDGDYYAFEYRIHDARLGRFLSVDPLQDEYPFNSSYAFAENSPIAGIDLEGAEFVNSIFYIHEQAALGNKPAQVALGFTMGSYKAMKSTWDWATNDIWTSQYWINTGTTLSYMSPYNFSADAMMFRVQVGVNSYNYFTGMKNWDAYQWGDAAGSTFTNIGLGMLGDKGIGKISNLKYFGIAKNLDNVVDLTPSPAFSLPKVFNSSASAPRAVKKVGVINKRVTWKQSEMDVLEMNPGFEKQRSFLGHEKANYGTKGSSRPDGYNFDTKTSLEVKNYDLTIAGNDLNLAQNITKQINQRIVNLPEGTFQRVVIDLRGQVLDDLAAAKSRIENYVKLNAKTTNYSIEYLTD